MNLRVLDDDDEALYAIDGVFTSDDDLIDYLDDVYPVLIDRFEAEFPESQLQYYEPDVDK